MPKKSFIKLNDLLLSGNSPQCIISLTNRYSSNYIFRDFVGFFSKIFCYYVAAHAESNSDNFSLRVPVYHIGHHLVQISCASIAEYSVRGQFDIFQCPNVVENCAPISFSLSMVYKCSYVDGFTRVTYSRAQHQCNIL